MKTKSLLSLACLLLCAGAAAAASPASGKGGKKHTSPVCSVMKSSSCGLCDYVSNTCGAASQTDLDAFAARMDAKIAELEASDATFRLVQGRVNEFLTSVRSTVVTVDVAADGTVSCTVRDSDFPRPNCLLDSLTGTLDVQLDCPSGFLMASQALCNSDMRSTAWPLTQVGSIGNTAYCSLIPPAVPLTQGSGVAELTVGCQYDIRILQQK